MDAAGFCINHLLAIAVVCRDDERAVLFQDCVNDFANAAIHRLNCFDGGIQRAGMSHHVAVCVVQHD